MAELPRLRVGLTLDSATFIRETNKVIDSVNKVAQQTDQQTQVATKGFTRLNQSIGFVKNSLISLAAGVGITGIASLTKQIIATADEYQKLSARVRISIGDNENFIAVQQRLFDVAQNTRQGLSTTTEVFARLANAMRDTGTSAADVLNITETLGKAIAVSGTSSSEASAALLQLSQAMGSGRLQGDELRSILENMPILARAIAKEMDVTIGELKDLGKEGAITADIIATAIRRMAPQIEKDFARVPITVGDAMTQVRNAITQLVGDTEKSTRATNELGKALSQMAQVIGSSEFRAGFQAFVAEGVNRFTASIEEAKRVAATIQDVAQYFTDFKDQSLAAIQALVEGTQTWLGAPFRNAFASVSGALEETKQRFKSWYDYIIGQSVVPDTIRGIEQWLGQLDSVLVDPIDRAVNEANLAFAALNADAVENSISATSAAVGKLNAKGFQEFINSARGAYESLTRTGVAGKEFAEQFKRIELVETSAATAVNKSTVAIQTQSTALARSAVQIRGWRAELEGSLVRPTIYAVNRTAEAFAELPDHVRKGLLDSIGEIEGWQETLAREPLQIKTAVDSQAATDDMQRAFESAADSIQQNFADTFTTIFEGGVTSAQDFGKQVFHIFTQLAGQIASLMVIKPVLAGTLGGVGAAGPGLVSQLGLGAVGGAPGGFLGAPSGATLGGLILSGGLGAVGGSLLGGFFGGQGRIGGGVGGGLGAVAGTAFLGPLGGLAGGLLGGLGGGFLGSLFGGGGGQSNDIRIRGALGATAGSTGAGGQFVTQFDQQISALLDDRQLAVANQALAAAQAVSVKYSKTPSANDLASLAAGRIGPTASALGFNAGLITQGTPEQQLANLQKALEIQKQITSYNLGPIVSQFSELDIQFRKLSDDAIRLGVSTDGLAVAHQRAREALERQIRTQQIQVGQQVGALDSISAQFKTLEIQMQEAQAQAVQLGISTEYVAAAHAQAAKALERQIQLQQIQVGQQVGALDPISAQFKTLEIQMQQAAAQAAELGLSTDHVAEAHARAARALAREIQLQQIQVGQQVGALDPISAQFKTLEIQMRQAAAQAYALGVSTENVARTHKLAEQALAREIQLEQLQVGQQVGAIDPLTAQLRTLEIQMQKAGVRAWELGVSTDNVTRAHKYLAEQLVREFQAQQDLLALSVTNPFEQLADPLESFLTDLKFANLNPLQQLEQARKDFERIANLARAGSTVAIGQLQGASELFIRLAEQVGASPGGVSARAEVSSVIESVLSDINRAQKEAAQGLESEIRRASDREIDTLRELIGVSRELVNEYKRTQRG